MRRTHARFAQIGTYEEAVRSGYLAYHEDLDRTLFMGGDRPRDVLPIELLNSFDLLANARVEYVDAIVDYNRAQFAMYVALGQPPANALAHPVPVDGVVPRNVPAPRSLPRVAPAPPTARSGCAAGRNPLRHRRGRLKPPAAQPAATASRPSGSPANSSSASVRERPECHDELSSALLRAGRE